MIQEIHIDWDGPFSYKEMQKMNGKSDFGVYQFYGFHPVYGADTLLYIGKTIGKKCDQTFAARICSQDHEIRWDQYSNSDNMTAYIGRLTGAETPQKEILIKEVELAEQLLIYAHSPAYNSKELNLYIYEKDDDKWFNIHVFNWGKHKRLLPEVSGRRYARNYPKDEDFRPYSKGK